MNSYEKLQEGDQTNISAEDQQARTARIHELDSILDGDADGMIGDKQAPGTLVMISGKTRKQYIAGAYRMMGTIDNIGPFGHAFHIPAVEGVEYGGRSSDSH